MDDGKRLAQTPVRFLRHNGAHRTCFGMFAALLSMAQLQLAATTLSCPAAAGEASLT